LFDENNGRREEVRGGLSRRSQAKAEAGVAEETALKAGMEQKAAEFVEKGSEVYAKA